ncbi:hypothetical protein M419DRAFT_4545 [Trichoderma reesei RUT C-30]|jgi:hypothetical protein|uniref:Uncharacterized protein n=1 Tax=Hypocrea jecorina (strain ATCC 56765 / BCRC 32924 / NRRL 11460 / Rut C-30) TaxID=1344414 RepID=A0A024SJG8_HYPJR|nr:hypothetical protein M419DRAFT_4545 [Trichoderma reesei RUT C-30]
MLPIELSCGDEEPTAWKTATKDAQQGLPQRTRMVRVNHLTDDAVVQATTTQVKNAFADMAATELSFEVNGGTSVNTCSVKDLITMASPHDTVAALGLDPSCAENPLLLHDTIHKGLLRLGWSV